MNEQEKNDNNREDSILDNSKNETTEEVADDDIVRVTKVLKGQRSGSVSIYWRQNSLSFRGFLRNRAKKKPHEYIVHCFRHTSNKGKACNFSFKAKCSFDRTTDEFYCAENWVVLGSTTKCHLKVSNNSEELQDRL